MIPGCSPSDHIPVVAGIDRHFAMRINFSSFVNVDLGLCSDSSVKECALSIMLKKIPSEQIAESFTIQFAVRHHLKRGYACRGDEAVLQIAE